MGSLFSVLSVLAAGLLVGFQNEDAAKQDLAKLEGVWSFARVEVEGKKQPEVPFATHKMIVTRAGEYAILQGPRVTRGTIKLDPGKTPKQYDTTISTGPRKGVTTLGIYELGEDTWQICLPFRGKERPAALVSTPGSGLLFFVFKREKQDLKEALVQAARLELAGTWLAVSYSLDGNEAAAADLQGIKLVIDPDGKTAASRDGKMFIASTTTIDPTAKPLAIDISFTAGDTKGRTSLGIYKIEDDVLTICRAAPDKPRPTEFSSKPGSGHTFMTYRRDKAKAE
jgi:uncharacterized protein (TIGR03067 family)